MLHFVSNETDVGYVKLIFMLNRACRDYVDADFFSLSAAASVGKITVV